MKQHHYFDDVANDFIWSYKNIHQAAAKQALQQHKLKFILFSGSYCSWTVILGYKNENKKKIPQKMKTHLLLLCLLHLKGEKRDREQTRQGKGIIMKMICLKYKKFLKKF